MLALAKAKALSPDQFAVLGKSEVAYVKRIPGNGTASYALYAADGSFLWQFGDRELAFAALRQHELEPVSVH